MLFCNFLLLYCLPLISKYWIRGEAKLEPSQEYVVKMLGVMCDPQVIAFCGLLQCASVAWVCRW